MSKIDFDSLNFDKFRELAKMEKLSNHEKVGFPNEYREGKESAIFDDMQSKLHSLSRKNSVILEIGPGCGLLPIMLAELCTKNHSTLHLVDSSEMLNLLPDFECVNKWPGRFPEVPTLLESIKGKVDAVIVYSVIQYVFSEGNLWDFVDRCLMLLNDGGEIFLGDIPNITMRKRFFSSNEGRESHKKYTGKD
jgi:cyclopropane fatty-acyl-phospholipid synthase-like methyltransferase